MAMIPLERDVIYPESDGRPVGESDLHREELWVLVKTLEIYYKGSPDVYVTGNLFFYYEEGNPRAVVCPDVCVVKGVSNHKRLIYKLWEEDKVPCFVVEVTSRSTRREDLIDKMAIYARLGVAEYFLDDPRSEYLHPRLQGFRLEGERFRPLEPAPDGSFLSQTTGLTLRIEDELLRLVDTRTGKPLPRYEELLGEVEREKMARLKAEEEVVRLRRRLADLDSGL